MCGSVNPKNKPMRSVAKKNLKSSICSVSNLESYPIFMSIANVEKLMADIREKITPFVKFFFIATLLKQTVIDILNIKVLSKEKRRWV